MALYVTFISLIYLEFILAYLVWGYNPALFFPISSKWFVFLQSIQILKIYNLHSQKCSQNLYYVLAILMSFNNEGRYYNLLLYCSHPCEFPHELFFKRLELAYIYCFKRPYSMGYFLWYFAPWIAKVFF